MKRLFVSTIFFAAVFISLPAPAQEVLRWEDCIRETAKNNPELISATEAIKQSQASRKITASDEYPQLTGSVSASTSKTGSASSADSYSASLSASQLVFDGKQTVNNVKSAQESVKAAKHNFRYASSGVRQALRQAFVNLLKAQEMIRIAREIFDIRRQNYELITLRYRSGLEHRGALYTAEANLAQAQYNINTADRDLRVAQTNLAKQLGRGKWSDISVEADFAVGDIPDENTDIEALAQKNPQVLKATAQKNAAQFGLSAAYGNYAPSVSVSANAGKSGATFLPKEETKGVGISLSMPLLEGGLRSAQIAKAEAELNQLKESERIAKDSALAALEQYRASLLEAIENVEVQKKSLQATEERSRIAEAQYSIGTISFDSWTIIEDNLVSAKRSYLNAQAEALLSEANWVMAKGETLEYQE